LYEILLFVPLQVIGVTELPDGNLISDLRIDNYALLLLLLLLRDDVLSRQFAKTRTHNLMRRRIFKASFSKER